MNSKGFIDDEEQTRKILLSGSAQAAKVIVDILSDETTSKSMKLDCAKEILTRLYGRTFDDSVNDLMYLPISEELSKYTE